MAQFYDQSGLGYHVTGGYLKAAKQSSFTISSTYAASRFPDEHRKLLTLTLRKEELVSLVAELQKIVDDSV